MFTGNPRPHKILLVDDDPNQILFLRKTLSEIGTVYYALDGASGIEQARTLLPDLILLDIEMPQHDGFAVCAALRERNETRNIPVIFMTGHDSTETQLRCFKEGGVDFIGKPFQLEVVGARVRTHLELQQKNRILHAVNQHARVTLASIGDAVITTDIHGVVTYLNPVAEFMTGMSKQQALGQEIEKVMPLRIGEAGPPHVNPVRLALSEGRTVGMAMDCQMFSSKGRWMPVEDSAAPLFGEQEEVLGAVIVFHDVSEARAMAIKMSHLAHFDQLTNLPNRVLLVDRMENELAVARRTKRRMGIMSVNIDRFRFINEEFGFPFGDEVLKGLTASFQAILVNGETLSRYNADEFIVVVPNIDRVSQLADLAVALQIATTQWAPPHAKLDNLTVSIGISVYPDDASDQKTLMRHADAGLYKAKQESKGGGFSFFSNELETTFIQRRKVQRILMNAVANDAVVVLYQPQVEARSGKVQAVEALMRIKHADGSLLLPADFIGIAEETRLIVPLGMRLIKLVLQQLRHWIEQGQTLRVCINVSPLQFNDPGFWPFLREMVSTMQIPPQRIELELTESLMLHDVDAVVRTMHAIRQFGISLSLDDFGTGYSSLAYLKSLPIDVLKIDRSFCADIGRNPQDKSLVQTIVAMAQNIGLTTVAEGVETPEQLSVLEDMGVDLLQGYHFSRPIPAGQIRFHYDARHHSAGA